MGIFIQRQITLLENDFHFHVVYVQAINDLTTDFDLVSTKVSPTFNEHIVYFKNNTGVLKKLINFYRYKKAQKIGVAAIKAPIDLCHIHVPYRSAMPALRLYKKNKTPFFITEHWSGHLNGQYQQKNAIDKFLYRRIINKATKISTVSKALQKAFLKNTKVESQIIPNYIERIEVAKTTNTNQTINLLTVGDFDDKTKNITGILHAFKAALATTPNLKLTLIGGGPDEEKIKRTATALEIPHPQIEFLGRQNHAFVLNAMTKCDFYICNSRYETFGMTVAEALFCGKPVIATRCGGPEEFLHSNNGILISANNTVEATELTEAIKKMSSTFNTYDANKISTEINNLFGKDTIHKKWLDFYKT